MLNALNLSSVVFVAAVPVQPKVANASLWRATITPLASIIGNGFLVLGLILNVSFGGYAPIAMLTLRLIAWGFSDAIRFKIMDLDHKPGRGGLIARMEIVSSANLAFALFISIAYYLNLFGTFGVSLTSVDDSYHARLLTTAVFILILIVG